MENVDIEFQGTHMHVMDETHKCKVCGKSREELLHNGHDEHEFGQ